MASRALLFANMDRRSSAVCHRWQVRCSSAVRGVPIPCRRMKNASFICCAYVGGRAVTENAKDVVAVSRCAEEKKGWVHFVGIGGYGLSALAMLALKQGFDVSGSDIRWSDNMDNLQEAGVKVYLGHSIVCMETTGKRPDAIIISSCIPKDNEEIVHAVSLGIPIYKRDSWLRNITEQYNLIAIAGTHGKSTTTAMLSYVLHAMGDDLIAVVGAHVPQFSEGNIIPGKGPNFVLEADEYDCCFLGLSPSIAVVTNMEWEHVDLFDDEEHVQRVFRMFVQQIKSGGHLIMCGDSAGAHSLLRDCKPKTLSNKYICSGSLVSDAGFAVTTYGMSSKMDWHASSVTINSQGGQDYILHHKECPLAEVSLKLPGNHNVLNSLAVIATIANLIKDRDVHDTVNSIKYHLSKFEGISRRFEFIGKVNGCCVYDDYAHHPTEIRATLQTARQLFPFQPLWVVFQAHSFSRIAAFMKDFSTSFLDADYVIITEVYSPREKHTGNCYGKDLATLISDPASEYIPKMVDVLEKLVLGISAQRNQETIVFTIGTDSEITALGPKLLRRLQEIS
ncbi:hypothetical protein KFK09_001790 [Dendrobium nobile]|uniref:UDP-N-acetylmuramate--L-alanine ligase n=1 Tax=Dendrobium nobile TaxID=94219 RepID=A0A8T3C645_DENNO|nr:hypothetical protein KFK09_001790 [Dendrobium nobile]